MYCLVVVRDFSREDVRGVLEVFLSARFDFPWGFYFNVDDDVFDDVSFGELAYPLLAREGSRVLVGVVDGRVVGFGNGYPSLDDEGNFYIGLLVVHRDFRGRGVGRALIREFFRFVVSKGFRVLSLHTWAPNRAMYLYERCGFVWVPDSNVYMVNFLPQLWRYSKFRELFGDPTGLVDLLVGPAEKLVVGDRVFWVYRWRVGGVDVEVVFDSGSRLPVGLRVGEFYVRVHPPEGGMFLMGGRVRFRVESSDALPVFVGGRFLGFTGEKEFFEVDVADKVEVVVGEYKLGFDLRVRDKIDLVLASSVVASPGFNRFLIINRGNEEFKGVLVVNSATVKVEPSCFDVSLAPGESKDFVVFVEGCGKVTFSVGGVVKSFVVPCEGRSLVDGKEVLLGSWRVGERTVKFFGGDEEFYYLVLVGSKVVSLKLDKDSGEFKGSSDYVDVVLRPVPVRDGVLLDFRVVAKRDVRESFKVRLWFEDNGDEFFLLPISRNEFVKGRVVYPAFPRAFSLFRKSLPNRVIGFGVGGKVFLVSSNRDFLYSYGYTPFDSVLEYPLNLKRGDEFSLKIRINRVDCSLEALGFNARDLIELGFSGGELILRNNWLRPLSLNLKVDGKTVDIDLEPGEEKNINIGTVGVENCIARVSVDVEGFQFERELISDECLKLWRNNVLKRGDVFVSLSSIGGTLSSWKASNRELLLWNDEVFRHSSSIPFTHGGISLLLMVDGKEVNTSIKKWDKKEEGVFEYGEKGVKVVRKWIPYFRDGAIEAIMERIEITNEAAELKNIRCYWLMYLRENIEKIAKDDYSIENREIMNLIGRKLLVETRSFKIIVENEKHEFNASKLANGENFIRLTCSKKLSPRETIAINNKIIVSVRS